MAGILPFVREHVLHVVPWILVWFGHCPPLQNHFTPWSFPCILHTSLTAGPHPLHGPLFIYLCLSLDSYFLPALPINSCPSLSFIPYLVSTSSKSHFLMSPVGRPQRSHYLSFETLSTYNCNLTCCHWMTVITLHTSRGSIWLSSL